MFEHKDYDSIAERIVESGPKGTCDLEMDHPADVAEVLDRVATRSAEKAIAIFNMLDPETASETLLCVNDKSRSILLAHTAPGEIAKLLEEMESDDAVDVISEVEENKAEEILLATSDDVENEVNRLLSYDEETAGGIMQTELFMVRHNMRVEEAIEKFRLERESVDDVLNIFVVDSTGKLVGVAPIQELILSRPDVLMGDLVDDELHFVKVDADQEEVANLFKRYDLLSMPVVSANGTLMGRITIDDIIDVIEEEASEDIIMMAGADDEALDQSNSIFQMAGYRFPWLASSLVSGFLTGLVIWYFNHPGIERMLLLTAFIPIVMGMSGNVGTQSSALVIRGLATGQVLSGGLVNYLLRELWVGLLLGFACGVVTGTMADLWQGAPMLGLVVGLSLFISIFFAALLGTAIPLMFKKINIDPAVAGGPLVLALNDLSSTLIFFTVASVLFARLG